MNTATAFDKFTTLEANLDLFQWQIHGVYVWQRIRNAVFRELIENTDVSEESESDRQATNETASFVDLQLHRAKKLYFAGLGFTTQNPVFAGQTDIIFKGNPPYRRELQSDGTWWDIICDPVMAHLSRDYFNIDSGFQIYEENVTPLRTEHVRYIDHVTLIHRLKGRLGLNTLSFPQKDREMISHIQQEAQFLFGVDIDVRPIIEHEFNYRQTTRPFYECLLKRVDPKTVIITYNPGSTTLVEVSKQMDIPVIELQHGMITEYQPTYSYPRPESRNDLFPDYLFVFGELWRDSVDYPIDNDHVIPVGYPHIEEQYNQYAGMPNDHQIVFISQYIVGKSLSKFAAEFANQHSEYHVVYKLHPNEYNSWRRAYPWLSDADITVVDQPEESLHEILAKSKIQVGVVSTALYEGLNYNLETFLVDLPGIERMNYLIENDYVTVVDSVSELEEAITQKQYDTTSIDPETVFKRNSIENILEAIEDVIERHG